MRANARWRDGPDPAIVILATDPLRIPTGITLMANAVGDSYYLIEHNIGGRPLFSIIRVSTHADIARLRVPYGAIYMFVGRDDFVLTVFAEFTDGQHWDVSQHPYLEYGTDDTAIAEVDQSGRISAKSVGTTTIWIQPVAVIGLRLECRVHVATVAEWVSSGNAKARKYKRPKAATKQVFVVSNGYVERERFEQHAAEVSDRLFAEANSPFRYFAGSKTASR